MSIEITKLTGTATAVVRMYVSAAPAMKASYVDADILPYFVQINYRHVKAVDPDGWVSHSWAAVDVRVVGHRVLKPAKDGSQRISDTVTHDRKWYDTQAVDPDTLPDWLADLVEEARPYGAVDLVEYPK